MKLVTINANPNYRSGALLGGEVLDFALAARFLPAAGWIPADVSSIIDAGADGLDLVKRVVHHIEDDNGSLAQDLRESGALAPLSEVRLAAPLPRPSIVVCAGMSFREHVLEMSKRRGIENPKMPLTPRGFLKNPNAIVGPGEAIVLPEAYPDKVDFEGEFAFVFGRPCHNVTEADAMDYIAGYTILNDVSARNWASQGMDQRDQNLLGKQFPSFCPLGPVLCTKDEIPDPESVHLTTRLNGEVMQSSGMDDLIFSIPQIIVHYAKYYRFVPGDIVTTGTPSGAGHGRKPSIYMKPGDWIEVEVTGVGRLGNPVVAAGSNLDGAKTQSTSN